MYAPNDPALLPIVEHVAKMSNLTISTFNEDPTKMESGSIVACDSQDQIINFLWDHQNVTQAGIFLFPSPMSSFFFEFATF